MEGLLGLGWVWGEWFASERVRGVGGLRRKRGSGWGEKGAVDARAPMRSVDTDLVEFGGRVYRGVADGEGGGVVFC